SFLGHDACDTSTRTLGAGWEVGMHGVLAALIAADEIDPATVRPVPLSAGVFTFLALTLVVLLWSFVRHVRRAQANLGSAQQAQANPGPTQGSRADSGSAREDDSR
ncbi:MAG: hypothetical protein WCF36_12710, partial [Candidatus Nanopelagicales bacterium]